METVRVKLYRQKGSAPDPTADEFLGEDTTFGAGGEWEVDTTGWTEGHHTVYALGYDLAGNESGFFSRKISVLPDPMRVSGRVAWTIGEIGSTRIGSFSA